MNAGRLIERLNMQPHPEGGHFVETYRAQPVGGARGAVTCIYYLLQAGERSAWHRIDATEIWHFQAGAALEVLTSSNGTTARATRLGPDTGASDVGHTVVEPHVWQSAHSLGKWTLVSCTVAPAFSFDGFEMAPHDFAPSLGLR